MVLQDGGAHKHVWMMKGDSGNKCCLGCRNLYAESSGVVDEDGDSIMTCSLILKSELDFATDIIGTVDRLADTAALRPRELKIREIAAGMVHSPYNMLLHPVLRPIVKPVSHFAHDWMHTFVVHGVFNTVMFLLLTALVAAGVTTVCDDLEAYCKTLVFLQRLKTTGAKLSDMFSKQRWNNCK